ncbi:MAG TPA: glycosyltransferase family 4 protein [Candidatus Krumholzibacteria bacterium]|nr:glycosyltransferase family 4 protein [Candidatus Krumholzibacteria bacterium]HPD72762.1 glycosyltransferase family 4 protein [Candidatus Krumholzibacteria bacterium]HRY40306.1 glycosyltransferase family 4 protein [Candidatus Krumholzibacteria bacterium]
MRILAVNWRDIGDPLGGGAEQHLHHILAGAARAGHEVELIVAAYPGAPADDSIDGVRIRRRGDWRVANFVLPREVQRRLREESWDLLVEDINKIPFYTPLYAGRVPVVAIVPHLFGRTVYRETNPLAATYVWMGEWPLRAVYRRAWFEVISPSTADDLVARGLPRDRISVIYCGLDHARFHLADPPPRSAHPLVVCWSRLRRYKSNDVAIRAFAHIRDELPQAELLVMGRGPDEPRLRRLARRLDLDERVRFTGHLAWDELVRTLHRAQLCLNPSPKEGWGLTVIEANQCGVPVIASDRPGLRDSVRDGQTGLLVPYGEPRAMAQAALSLLHDPDLWACFSDGARAWAESFSWPRCVAESLDLFARAASRGTAAP